MIKYKKTGICQQFVKKDNIAYLSILLILVLLPFGIAHLEAGEDRKVGEYRVDFGYAPEDPRASEAVSFALNLLNDTEQLDFDNAWVRISSGKEVVFSGFLHPISRSVAFNYRFPYPGDYEIHVRFSGNYATMADTSFTINVKDRPGFNINFVFILLAVLVFFALGKFYKRRDHHDKNR